MQNMHKTTHDRPLTGVHLPDHGSRGRGSGAKDDLSTSTGDTHRGAGWRTEAIIHVTTRDLDRIIDRTICLSTRAQEAKGYGLDLILTDVGLRKLYFSLVHELYFTNKIYDFKELDWILYYNISLTKCHLEFEFKGNRVIILHSFYLWYTLNNLFIFIQLRNMKFIQE